MAKNLLEKLNTLVKASIPTIEPPKRLGHNLEREVAALRDQLEAAYEDEQGFVRQAAMLEETIMALDEQADTAVLNNQEAVARHAIQQMEHKKRQLTMLQADLEHHRNVTADLLSQINTLEGMISAAQQEDDADADDDTLSVADAIRQARQSVQREAPQTTVKGVIRVPITVHNTDDEDEPDEVEITENLAARRSRLQKPDA